MERIDRLAKKYNMEVGVYDNDCYGFDDIYGNILWISKNETVESIEKQLNNYTKKSITFTKLKIKQLENEIEICEELNNFYNEYEDNEDFSDIYNFFSEEMLETDAEMLDLLNRDLNYHKNVLRILEKGIDK